jgi:glycosyltransferase involved in cell wall biosynthesis
MRRILVTAYDVNPYRGSEAATGWNFIVQIARYNHVLAVTRENNRPHIERFMREHGISGKQLKFYYFDLPAYLRFWKRGGRGSSLYFYLWQLCMPLFVRRRGLEFDIAHNLNFHADWAPSMLWVLGRPLVWGPVGHHPRIPGQFLRPYGWKSYGRDRATWAVKRMFWMLDPLLRACKRRAAVILTINSDVERVLSPDPSRVFRLPAVGTEGGAARSSPMRTDLFTVLSVGRFVPLKGFDVTIRSFAAAIAAAPAERQRMKLVVVGEGPERERLVRLSRDLGIEDRVEFIDWIERESLLRLYASASVFFFPSHEGAGMVVAEALSHGLPVVCFDNVGPGEFVDETCGRKVPYLAYDESVEAFSRHLLELARDPALRERLSAGACVRFRTTFDWNVKGDTLARIYRTLVV